MGSILSYILSSNTVAAFLFMIIIGLVIWNNQSSKKTSKRQNRQASMLADKKRSKTAITHEDANKQTEKVFPVKASTPGEDSIPGGLSGGLSSTDVEQSTLSSSGTLKKEKKKGKRSRTPIPSDHPAAGAHSTAGSSRSPIISADESNSKLNAEEAWTRVESRHRTSTSSQNVGTSDAGVTTTTSVDDDASSVGGLEKPVQSEANRLKPQKSAERLLPKGRKTDNVLETTNSPGLSRVMGITSPSQQPAPGFSLGDYEDADDVRGMDADGEDDGGWDVVVTKSRGKAKHLRSPQPDKAVESKTKKQRQNQARREDEKAAKEAEGKQREEALANHRRERERAIMEEQSKKKKKKQSALSGGMKAAVDAQGHLVWED